MIVRRVEDVLRISADGSLTIPASQIRACCRLANGTKEGKAEDLEDFGPGRLVVIGYASSESGTEITIQRDRRQEAKR
jgi:hypothetical protein